MSLLALCWLMSFPAHGLDFLQTYELGLSNDPKVLQAEASRNAAQKSKPIGLAKLLPTLSFTGNLMENHTVTGQSPIFRQANTDNVYWSGLWSLNLVQPIFHYDAWAQFWQADSQIAQAQAQLEEAYQDLATRVAKSYFGVLASEENLEFSQNELNSLDLQIAQVKERLALGFSTIVDLDTVQAQRDQVQADLILADQQLNDAKEALREIIGNNPANLDKVPDEFFLARPQPENLEVWRDTALQSNLLVIAAQNQAEFTKRNIDVSFAGHLPSLDLQGSVTGSDTNRPTGIAYQTESIGLQFTMPIYAGGGVNARVEQARDLYENSLQKVDQQRRAVERQVKDAFRGVFSAIGRVGALGTALKSAASALEATEVGYQVGTRTVVDVLVVQSKFFSTRRDYARSRYDYLINSLLLKQAAGILTRSDMEAVNVLIHQNRGAGQFPYDRPPSVGPYPKLPPLRNGGAATPGRVRPPSAPAGTPAEPVSAITTVPSR